MRCGFDPWVGKIPSSRAWQPSPVFLPGEFHRQRSLSGYSSQGHNKSDITEATQRAHSSVQFSGSIVSDPFATPWTAACQASLSITNSQSLLTLMSTELLMPSNHLILCHPLLLLPSIFPSIRVFSNETALYIMQPNYWNFSFSISSSNEYSGLISFRTDWFDLLAVQGTLKILLQHHQTHLGQYAYYCFLLSMLISSFPGGSMVENLPPVQETQETRVPFLGRKDLREEEMATPLGILAWKIPWTEEPDGLGSMGS